MPALDTRTPGQRVRWLREKRKIPRREFAGRVGMPYSTLADWENGRFTNTGKVPVHVIADQLGANIEWITSGRGNPDRAPLSVRESGFATFWGFALSREAAAFAAEWMKLNDRDPSMAALAARMLDALVQKLIDDERQAKRSKPLPVAAQPTA